MRTLETDYLVVGAGAMGMAFTDALIDHADVHVTMVDRRHATGGHWNDAYPFVQLHQASVFYGVASTVLGTGAVQDHGPEVGLQERARCAEIQAYYDTILDRRFIGTGRVTFLAASEYQSDGTDHVVTSRVSGERVQVRVRRRVVDAAYLSPTIPATTPPPFAVAPDGARVVPVNQLANLVEAPSEYVIVGSGKTATDGIVWLLRNGVDPERIVWVRPRDPWMLNRAMVQPDPAVALGLGADVMEAAAAAESLDDFFLRLEAASVMLRIDPHVAPSMAKSPTLGEWELDGLRTVERVVRMGHIRRVSRGELELDRGSSRIADDALGGALRGVGVAAPAHGADLGTRPDPPPDHPCGRAVLRRRAGRLRGGHPGRRPRPQPPVPAQRLRQLPRRLGADAGAGGDRGRALRRRTRHRRVGERLRPELVASTPRCATHPLCAWPPPGSRTPRYPGWRGSPCSSATSRPELGKRVSGGLRSP